MYICFQAIVGTWGSFRVSGEVRNICFAQTGFSIFTEILVVLCGISRCMEEKGRDSRLVGMKGSFLVTVDIFQLII